MRTSIKKPRRHGNVTPPRRNVTPPPSCNVDPHQASRQASPIRHAMSRDVTRRRKIILLIPSAGAAPQRKRHDEFCHKRFLLRIIKQLFTKCLQRWRGHLLLLLLLQADSHPRVSGLNRHPTGGRPSGPGILSCLFGVGPSSSPSSSS